MRPGIGFGGWRIFLVKAQLCLKQKLSSLNASDLITDLGNKACPTEFPSKTGLPSSEAALISPPPGSLLPSLVQDRLGESTHCKQQRPLWTESAVVCRAGLAFYRISCSLKCKMGELAWEAAGCSGPGSMGLGRTMGFPSLELNLGLSGGFARSEGNPLSRMLTPDVDFQIHLPCSFWDDVPAPMTGFGYVQISSTEVSHLLCRWLHN